jgi:hypothetical protein
LRTLDTLRDQSFRSTPSDRNTQFAQCREFGQVFPGLQIVRRDQRLSPVAGWKGDVFACLIVERLHKGQLRSIGIMPTVYVRLVFSRAPVCPR